MSKVAVASTDGITINEHFGRTKEFWIYEVNETGAYTFLERREIHQNIKLYHKHSASKVIELLADVEAVLAAQIGRQAELELQAKGILSLAVTSLVDKALVSYGKRGKYIRGNVVRRSVASCGFTSCNCSCGCK